MSSPASAVHGDGAAPTFYLVDEHDHAEGGSTMFGFWIYLMSDCLIFAVLFATYGVLGSNYAAGPSPKACSCAAERGASSGQRRANRAHSSGPEMQGMAAP